MGYTEAQMSARVSTVLQDAGTATWGTAVIRAQMDEALREFARYIPKISKSTVTFASTLPALSIAGITDLIAIDRVEYPVDQDPIAYRNWDVRGSSIIVDISFAPATGDTAYIWYGAPHTVDGTVTNTLKPEEERIIIEMVAAQLVINYALSKINTFNIGGGKPTVDFQAWGERKLAKAMQDIRAISRPRMAVEWPKVR